MRWPNGPRAASSLFVWISFQSPVSAAKFTISVSVIVRPAELDSWPDSNSSKYFPIPLPLQLSLVRLRLIFRIRAGVVKKGVGSLAEYVTRIPQLRHPSEHQHPAAAHIGFRFLHQHLRLMVSLGGIVVHLEGACGHVVYQRMEMIAAFGAAQHLARTLAKSAANSLPHQARDCSSSTLAKTRIRHAGYLSMGFFYCEVGKAHQHLRVEAVDVIIQSAVDFESRITNPIDLDVNFPVKSRQISPLIVDSVRFPPGGLVTSKAK